MGVIDQFINSKSVADCFAQAVKKIVSGPVRGLIVPHAGYIYSGSVAAAGFRLLKPSFYEKAMILGFYHGFSEEHSVEIQIPLLRHQLGDQILVEKYYLDQLADLEVSDQTLVVASSDLSHYQPSAVAQQLDQQTIAAILSRDEWRIKHEVEACGLWPILNLNQLANKFDWQPQLIDYQTSAAVTGDESSVVGYGCIAYLAN